MANWRMLNRAIAKSKKLANLKTDSARLLYTWLIPFLDEKGRYYGEPEIINGEIFSRLGKTDKNIEGYLEDMVKVGLIRWYEVDGDRYIEFEEFHKYQGVGEDREARSLIPCIEGANIIQVEEKEESKEKETIPYQEIVEYLNSAIGIIDGGYRYTTQKTQFLIKARWNEGFRLEDFKKVIDNQKEKWYGDTKMQQYLRPETLFGTKFESYLNCSKPKNWQD